ncbi:MAG TPA: ATP-binding cassette domain-containing protein [Solirubrobacteraceae bacterium]|nr:ATP-binding cassette domain-containing protein [Solirubrobacteraceae bacterium]
MTDRVLALDGVWKGFSRGGDWLHVLQGVSLSVGAGELAAVVGTRDQGKTTLLRVAAGMLPPEKGTVRLGKLELAALRERELSRVLRSEIGLAARKGPAVRVRVRDYVGLPLATGLRLRWQERGRRATEALRMLGVADCADMRWRELSNWQRVRVELAQALVGKPLLLLIDDVLDGFGLGKKQEAMEILRTVIDELGCGVLMAASDHTSVLPSDRVWQLDEGKLKLMADLTDGDLIPLHKSGEGSRVWYAES